MGRLGELLGEKAMDTGNSNDRYRIMKGWAKTHPEEALAFLSQQEDKDQQNLRSAWISGVCRDNPERALTALLADPDFSKLSSGQFMKEAVQTQGLEAAQISLQKALDTAPGDVANSPIFRSLFIELTNAMLFRSWQSGTTQSTCDWLEKQRGAPYLIEPLVGHAAYDLTIQKNAGETLAWLRRMDGGTSSGILPGASGLRKGILERPKSLIGLDDTTLGLIVAQFGSPSAVEALASKVDPIDASQAAKIRAFTLRK